MLLAAASKVLAMVAPETDVGRLKEVPSMNLLQTDKILSAIVTYVPVLILDRHVDLSVCQ